MEKYCFCVFSTEIEDQECYLPVRLPVPFCRRYAQQQHLPLPDVYAQQISVYLECPHCILDDASRRSTCAGDQSQQ